MPTSPCSVPDWLRVLIPFETPEQQAVCRWHDEQYERGGSHMARLLTDLHFCMRLMGAGMSPERAEQYLWGVRMYGGSHWAGGDKPGTLPPPPPSNSESP